MFLQVLGTAVAAGNQRNSAEVGFSMAECLLRFGVFLLRAAFFWRQTSFCGSLSTECSGASPGEDRLNLSCHVNHVRSMSGFNLAMVIEVQEKIDLAMEPKIIYGF